MWFMFAKTAEPKGFLSTPRCIHRRAVDYEYEKLHVYSKKFKIVPGHAYWDQEKFLMKKTWHKKSCDTVLSSPLNIHRKDLIFLIFKELFVS